MPKPEEIALVQDLRTLVKRCLEDDQAAMLALVERFRGQVYGLCHSLGREHRFAIWPDKFFVLNVFDHDHYNAPEVAEKRELEGVKRTAQGFDDHVGQGK